MLTIFSIPKAFSGHVGIIQDNAIGSWTQLAQDCEVVLFGDDPGVAEAAARHKVRHEPQIARNEFGTPVIADVFTRMDILAKHPFLALVNADIILLDDFLPTLAVLMEAQSRFSNFLAVASRFNCRIDEALAFEPGWDAALRTRARAENRMYPAAGSDIFVYPRRLFTAVPPFAIGRGYWDNWLMREALRRGAELIDLTAAVSTVHQAHTYDTVTGLSPESSVDKHVYATEEGRRNLALAGGRSRLYTVYDATLVLTADKRLHPTWRPSLLRRRIKASLRRLAAGLCKTT